MRRGARFQEAVRERERDAGECQADAGPLRALQPFARGEQVQAERGEAGRRVEEDRHVRCTRQRQPEEHADEFAGEQCPGREARAERAVRLEQRRTARAAQPHSSTAAITERSPAWNIGAIAAFVLLIATCWKPQIAHSSSIRPTARMSSARRTGRRRVWSSANLAGSARQLHDREGGASGALESAVSHGSVGVSGRVVAFGQGLHARFGARWKDVTRSAQSPGEPDRAVFRRCARAGWCRRIVLAHSGEARPAGRSRTAAARRPG